MIGLINFFCLCFIPKLFQFNTGNIENQSMKKFIIRVLFLNLLIAITMTAQDGEVTTFYPDGSGRSREYYAHGVHEGASYWYYKNGNLKAIKNYTGGKLDGWLRNYYETGIIKSEIHVKNGVLDGISSFYYKNGGLKETRIYSGGQLIKQSFVEYDSTYVAPPINKMSVMNKIESPAGEKEFLCDAEICPEPIGGMKAIQSILVYPKHAKLYGLEGDVLVAATIDKKGNVVNAKVVKGIGLGCDEAALDAVRKTKFIPAQDHGKLIEAEVSFKVKFRLKNKPDLMAASKMVKNSDVKLSDFVKTKTKSAKKLPANRKDNIKDKNRSKFIKCDIDICPEPKDGFLSIVKKIKYPLTAKRLGIEGDVVLKVNVDEFGIVTGVEIVKGIGYGCDQEAETAVYRTDFLPGEVDGKKVESEIELTIPFRIDAIK